MNYNIFETHSLSGDLYRYTFFSSFYNPGGLSLYTVIVFDQVMDVLFRDRNNEEKKDEHKRLGTTTSFIKTKSIRNEYLCLLLNIFIFVK